MSVTRLYPSGRHRMFRFAAALVVLGLVAAPLHAADKTITAKGTVKTVAADSLTITDSAGKDWTFKVDTNTKVVASGGSHKTADTKAMGKTPMITDEVKAGAQGVGEVPRHGRAGHARRRSPRPLAIEGPPRERARRSLSPRRAFVLRPSSLFLRSAHLWYARLLWIATPACHRCPIGLDVCANWRWTSGGAGTSTRAASFVRSTTRSGARPRTTPCACSARCRPRRSSARPRRRGSSEIYDAAIAHLDQRAQCDQHLVEPHLPRSGAAVHRVFLRRVRAAPVAADLRGRPRRPCGRSLQGSERPRRAAHGHRLHVPAGLLPPAVVGRRMAGRDLREAELGGCAD